MNSKAIRVENISHSYNGLKALDQVSYEVKPGEIFGLLGPNGAGKTTMIRILTGQLRPTAGQAWVAGWDVVEERDQLKPRVGVVFEFQNLYMRLSARDNLVFSARLYGVPKTRVDEVLLQVDIQLPKGFLVDRCRLTSPGFEAGYPAQGVGKGCAQFFGLGLGEFVRDRIHAFTPSNFFEGSPQPSTVW